MASFLALQEHENGHFPTYVTATLSLLTLRLVTAGVSRKSMRNYTERLPSLFSALGFDADLAENVRPKMRENLWYTLWHSWSFGYNLFVLLGTDWFMRLVRNYDTELLYGNFENFRLSYESEWFLDVNLAFWTTCALFVCIETIRKDFYQMIVHHVFTIALIVGANHWRQQRFSVVVLLLHDVVDIFLYVGKCATYRKSDRLAETSFFLFVASFFVCRLIVYPLACIIPCWKFMLALPASWMRTLPAMLTGLYLLHWFWWMLIVKMIRSFLSSASKTVDKDCRSDTDEESPRRPLNCDATQVVCKKTD